MTELTTYTLRTFSPLHIGGKQQILRSMEFITEGGRCFVVSETKLSRLITARGKLEELRRFIEAASLRVPQEGPPRIMPFLRASGLLNEETLKEISRYSSACPHESFSELRPMTRDAYDRPYIPGSAIKGALRNAVVYALLKKMPESKIDTIRRKIGEKLNHMEERRRKREPVRKDITFFSQDRDILGNLLTSLYLPEAKQAPHSDLFRLVKIGDSIDLRQDDKQADKDSAIVEKIAVFSAGSRGMSEDKISYVETIPAGVTVKFRFKIDGELRKHVEKENPAKRIAQQLGISTKDILDSVLHPFDCSGDFVTDLLEREKAFAKNQFSIDEVYTFNGEPPNLRIGWGGGLLSTTVDMLFPDECVRDLLDVVHPEHRRPGAPGPKTRRFICDGERPVGTLGWVRIEKESTP